MELCAGSDSATTGKGRLAVGQTGPAAGRTDRAPGRQAGAAAERYRTDDCHRADHTGRGDRDGDSPGRALLRGGGGQRGVVGREGAGCARPRRAAIS